MVDSAHGRNFMMRATDDTGKYQKFMAWANLTHEYRVNDATIRFAAYEEAVKKRKARELARKANRSGDE